MILGWYGNTRGLTRLESGRYIIVVVFVVLVVVVVVPAPSLLQVVHDKHPIALVGFFSVAPAVARLVLSLSMPCLLLCYANF